MQPHVHFVSYFPSPLLARVRTHQPRHPRRAFLTQRTESPACLLLFITAGPITKLFAGVEGDSGGHVQ
jgi:hypothetical protein